jgi:hypothetical protein
MYYHFHPPEYSKMSLKPAVHNPETAPLLSPPPPYKKAQSSTQLPAPTPNRSSPRKPSTSLFKKLEQLDATLNKHAPVLLNIFGFVLGSIVMGTIAVVVIGLALWVVGLVIHILYVGSKEIFH